MTFNADNNYSQGESSVFVDSSSSSHNSSKHLIKQLRFGHVEIRDMPMELGEHPPSEGGAPVTIGWEPISIRQLPLDVYEIYRADDPLRFGEGELRLDVSERAEILLEAGYTLEEIVQASEDAQQLLKQRQSSLTAQKREVWHVARESAQRKLSRVIHGKRPTTSAAA